MFANKMKELDKLLECGETRPADNSNTSRSLETYLYYLDANNLYGNMRVYINKFRNHIICSRRCPNVEASDE